MNNSQVGRPHHILLFERDTSVRELMFEVLVDANYRVLGGEDTPDPVDVPNLQPDLVILDLPAAENSPELDFVSHLKSDAHTAHIPILGLSKAYPSDDVPAWIQQKGIAGLLRKPFDLDEFLKAVQSAIEGANITAQAGRQESAPHHGSGGDVRSPL